MPKRSDDRTRQNLVEVLESEKWSNNTQARTFERTFAEFLGCECAVLATNATTALKLALLALDLRPGDEVIVPALTFPSVALAILECNAVPVICDVDPQSYCLGVSALDAAKTSRTRVILPTHLYCTQCDMPPILDFAQRNGLIIIEDCAHVTGTRRYDRLAGSWGKGAIFSFNQKKPLSCGEGGCFVTNDSELCDRIRFLLDFDGTTTRPLVRLQRMAKISEFQAAVLNGQLPSLYKRLKATEERAECLRLRLKQFPEIQMLPRLSGTQLQTIYNFCFRVLGLEDAVAFRRALSEELGLEMGTTYMPLDINQSLNCSHEYQFQACSIRIGKGGCLIAHEAYFKEAVRFPGYCLTADERAVEDIAVAIEKTLPHFLRESPQQSTQIHYANC
jgi:dTDP-4-amino-4,6-dideoxygalactose transaminase